MACFSPLTGYRSKERTESGKYQIVFKPSDGFIDLPINLPCGQCVGCRLERSRQWAIRCVHEASLYDKNCFITLTYAPEHMPLDGSLNVRDYQLFMKRLRKKFGANIRFYQCGEYGENFGRPHYHACLFNHDFPDKKLWKINNKQKLYTSETLQELWPYGFSSIGTVTFESAAYVARYIMKKITGDLADAHYETVDSDGVVTWRKPEYTTMSRRPGIGKPWLDKFATDVYPSDEVIIKGSAMRPPRFYDSQYELLYPNEMIALKQKRKRSARKYLDNNTPERLIVREQVQLARLDKLPRNLN